MPIGLAGVALACALLAGCGGPTSHRAGPTTTAADPELAPLVLGAADVEAATAIRAGELPEVTQPADGGAATTAGGAGGTGAPSTTGPSRGGRPPDLRATNRLALPRCSGFGTWDGVGRDLVGAASSDLMGFNDGTRSAVLEYRTPAAAEQAAAHLDVRAFQDCVSAQMTPRGRLELDVTGGPTVLGPDVGVLPDGVSLQRYVANFDDARAFGLEEDNGQSVILDVLRRGRFVAVLLSVEAMQGGFGDDELAGVDEYEAELIHRLVGRLPPG